MDLSGTIKFRANTKNVFTFFSNLSRLIPCLPNLISYEIVDENTAKTKFKANVGSIQALSYLSRVTASVIIQVVEVNEGNNQIKYKFNGNAAGLNYNGEIMLKLSEVGDGSTNVDWRASVDIGRVIETLSRFININDIVNNIINDIVNKLSQCMGEK